MISQTLSVSIDINALVVFLWVESFSLLDHYKANSTTYGNCCKCQCDKETNQSVNQHEAQYADTGGDGCPSDVASLKSHELQRTLQSLKHLVFHVCLCHLCHNTTFGLVTDTEEEREGIGCGNQEDTSTDGHQDLLLEILLIARNVLIINTNWSYKMTKETN